METGTITEVVRTERQTKSGATYYEIIIDDSPIKRLTATKGQLETGQKINYIIENDYVTIIKDGDQKYTKSYPKSNNKSEPIEHKLIGFSMSYSKDLVIAGKIELNQMSDYFDKIYDKMKSKI